ncbi:unnamed protein product [Gongylonema pulchrum]|uniref:Uncharacterized protein n=1 Tax=Gongylonema pulchrum TaxID=637853 RepID=A0A183CZI4_9BILA|nr:unnamed protein product [Gongylonema pulchrum]
MEVLRMSSLSADGQVFFEWPDRVNGPVIRAGTLSDLGRVHFVPSANCTDDCYVGKNYINATVVIETDKVFVVVIIFFRYADAFVLHPSHTS